jgi:hypothetical protein
LGNKEDMTVLLMKSSKDKSLLKDLMVSNLNEFSKIARYNVSETSSNKEETE